MKIQFIGLMTLTLIANSSMAASVEFICTGAKDHSNQYGLILGGKKIKLGEIHVDGKVYHFSQSDNASQNQSPTDWLKKLALYTGLGKDIDSDGHRLGGDGSLDAYLSKEVKSGQAGRIYLNSYKYSSMSAQSSARSIPTGYDCVSQVIPIAR